MIQAEFDPSEAARFRRGRLRGAEEVVAERRASRISRPESDWSISSVARIASIAVLKVHRDPSSRSVSAGQAEEEDRSRQRSNRKAKRTAAALVAVVRTAYSGQREVEGAEGADRLPSCLLLTKAALVSAERGREGTGLRRRE